MSQTSRPGLRPGRLSRLAPRRARRRRPGRRPARDAGRDPALVAEAGDLLRVRPEPGEWSVARCIGHIVDSELVAGARERWIIAEDEPEIVGYDQALWVAGSSTTRTTRRC